MKILVVDDDPDIVRLCAKALRAQGHSVVTCDSGGPALQAALREEFDLALCDLNLPDIHGLELVRAIKMQAPALSVIVMSALDPAEWTKASTAAGAAFFLSKPLRLDTLRHEVNMVERSRAGLEVIMVSDDRQERRVVTEHFRSAGCVVHHGDDVADAVVLLADHAPDLVIVDGDQRDAHVLITVCGRKGVACFVLAGPLFNDEDALREGASLVMQRPAIPDDLLLQARFLTRR